MNEDKLGLFDGEDMPSVEVVWKFFDKGRGFNTQINLEDSQWTASAGMACTMLPVVLWMALG